MIKSVKYKLTLFVFFIILLLFFFLTVTSMIFAIPFIRYEKKEYMVQLFKTLEYENDVEEIIKICTLYDETYNIYAFILDSNGLPVYSSHNFIRLNQTQPPPSIQKPKHEVVDFDFKEIVKGNRGSLYYKGFGSYGQEIFINTSIMGIENVADSLNRYNIIFVLIFLLPMVFVTYVFSKRFVIPIEKINDVTSHLAKLDFSKKVTIYKGEDEIHSLGVNINSMADQLKCTIESLEEANLQLQADVDYQMQLNDLGKQFIADVSHELKSPLALITMYCQNLKSDNPRIDKEFYCDATIDECLRLGELVKSLLDISALENRLTQLNIENTDFSEYVSWILSKNEIVFDEKELKYTQFVEENIFVDIDGFYMEQVIKNLLNNAAEYSTGDVIANLRLEKDDVIFSVYNSCESLSDDDIKAIWTPFHRLNDDARTQSENSHKGLGLHIIKTIVVAHLGEWGVFNKDDGVEFFVKLKKSSETLDV